ncbi:unnamed protein product [Prorocentrum cordatum]|uniref:Uncharacterized protein n=1 Tax=Prorocentrum cordatum TaxID=2364126 RepID=A0ABN9VND9_9DINO|nr:unnamed protein product [Polarella glacialis]
MSHGARLCRCVMVGQTCDGDMDDGNWATTVYNIGDLATSTTTTEDPRQSAIGDPLCKVCNYGQRFDLMRQGDFVLISIPRGEPFENALLVVEAVARSLGGRRADMYFVKLNITGAWADNAQAGGLSFSANSAPEDKPKWAKFGPVELKVAHGRTDK